MEAYFQEIAIKIEGYEDFEKESWSFKVRSHLYLIKVRFLIGLA